jgi:hypothetical protein
MWREPHVRVDYASISSGRSICPRDPKFSSSNPDFNPDPDAHAGCTAEIPVTVLFELQCAFVIDCHLNDNVRIRVPNWEEFQPRRRRIGKCSGANAVRGIRTLDGTGR